MSHHRIARTPLAAAAAVLLLAACGGEKPEALLASAKEYLAKNEPKAAVIQIKNALQQDANLPEARFLLGKALLDSRDPVGAEVELRKALDAKYPPDQVLPLLARSMLHSGQARKLLSDFPKIELTSPEAKADVQTTMAIAQASLGHSDQAKAAIASALALQPDFAPAMLAQARLAAFERDFPGALAGLDTILAKAPQNDDAWNLKGDILAQKEDFDGALVAYGKAVEARPDAIGARGSMVRLLMKANRLPEAAEHLAAMKKAMPKNPQTLFVEAEYLYRSKDFQRARDVTQELLRLLPNDPNALLLAGAVHFELKSMTQAEDYLSRVVKLAPGKVAARRMLAVIYLRTSQPAKAKGVLEPILEDAETDSNLLTLAGEMYMQNGNVQRAEEYFAKASTLDPQNAVKKTRVALTHLAAGKGEAAVDELERIASADTGISADMALISSAVRRKDFAKALKAIDGLEKKQPDKPLAHALRGTVLVAKGDVAGGRKSFEKALAVSPTYFSAASALAGLDLRDNRPDDARKRFETLLAADPKNTQALLALAELIAKSGAPADQVAAQIAKAVAANPADPGPRQMLIGFHLRNRDFKKAMSAAQDALAAIPDRPELLDMLARAQQGAGDVNQAIATYGKVVALLPNSAPTRVRMAELELAAKNSDGALQNLRKALEIRPDYVPAQRGLVLVHVQAGRHAEALAVAQEIKKQRPKEALAYVLEGDIAASRKAWGDAVAAYRAGLKQTPAAELAVKTYAALQASGAEAEANRFATTWLADHASDGAFRLMLAETATRRKDFVGAVKHYQVLLQSQPNNPVLLNNTAWALGQLKDPKALDYAERAYKVSPRQPAIMDTLAMLLLEKGDKSRALDLIQKAVGLAPEAPELKLTLARVHLQMGNKADARKALEALAKLGDRFAAQPEVARLLKESGG